MYPPPTKINIPVYTSAGINERGGEGEAKGNDSVDVVNPIAGLVAGSTPSSVFNDFTAMGFEADRVRRAWDASGHDRDIAMDLLLTGWDNADDGELAHMLT